MAFVASAGKNVPLGTGVARLHLGLRANLLGDPALVDAWRRGAAFGQGHPRGRGLPSVAEAPPEPAAHCRGVERAGGRGCGAAHQQRGGVVREERTRTHL